MEMLVLGAFSFLSLVVMSLIIAIVKLRRVVPTNEEHIVQSSKATTSYGKATGNGNTYYEWPSFLPVIGVTKIVLPVSVFDLDLDNYEAYDKGRLPFVVDVKAFFRISDSNMAAQRVSSFTELKEQLVAIVQGAVRTVLASNDIEEILQGRSKFGDEFTNEVKEQLSNWGVATVKNIELMDLRDSQGSAVIKNIMEKKKSFIEMESRQEVARNKKAAEVTEIEARREVDLQKQEAEQQVGLRTVENKRQVSLANESAVQSVQEQARVTKEKQMAVIQVEEVKKAEIIRQTQVIKAEQEKQTTLLAAEAKLEAERRAAEAITLNGSAKAEAEKAMQLAPVEAQIVLAKEIGDNKSYQDYLITLRKVEAQEKVGVEQAKALNQAEIKVIANSNSASSGLNSAMDVFSSQGGTQIGAMLEGLANTDTGKALLNAVGVKDEPKVTTKH